MYQIVNDPFTHQMTSIKRLEDGAFIPLDPRNIDYQAYLEWIGQEGNQPLPAA